MWLLYIMFLYLFPECSETLNDDNRYMFIYIDNDNFRQWQCTLTFGIFWLLYFFTGAWEQQSSGKPRPWFLRPTLHSRTQVRDRVILHNPYIQQISVFEMFSPDSPECGLLNLTLGDLRYRAGLGLGLGNFRLGLVYIFCFNTLNGWWWITACAQKGEKMQIHYNFSTPLSLKVLQGFALSIKATQTDEYKPRPLKDLRLMHDTLRSTGLSHSWFDFLGLWTQVETYLDSKWLGLWICLGPSENFRQI